MQDIVYDYKPTASKPGDIIRKSLFRYEVNDDVQRLPPFKIVLGLHEAEYPQTR